MLRKILFLLLVIPSTLFAQLQFVYDQSIPVERASTILENAWAGGLNAAQLHEIDLDGDLINDLVIFDRTNNKVNTYLRKGARLYYQPDYEMLFPEDISGWMILEDYNNDGLKDIFTSSIFGIRVFKNITTTGGKLAFELSADPLFTEGSSGQINLQMNSTDIPAITDVDGDGDIDILVFDFAGSGTIEYHQNQAIELGNPEGHVFIRKNRRWGNIEECDCSDFAFGETCAQKNSRTTNLKPAKLNHAGGKSLLLIDVNGDGLRDLLIGDEECTEISLLVNDGTTEIASFSSLVTDFPQNTTAVDFFTFPAGYHLDVDSDGVKDLIFSPNVPNNILDEVDFENSMWFYKNTNTDALPVFELVKRNFLQDEMIDIGENAAPAVFDADQDGDQDLFIGGKTNTANDAYAGKIQYYENIGSPSSPAFRLSNADFLNISAENFKNITPAFKDINGDNKADLLFKGTKADNQTRIYYILNTGSGVGSTFDKNYLATINVNINLNDHFTFFDINRDGLTDLLIGKVTGRLEYYENIGTLEAPAFALSSASFYGIADSPAKRNLVPGVMDLQNDGNPDLVLTDATGVLTIYPDFLDDTKPSNAITNIINNDKLESLHATRLGRLAIPVEANLYGSALPDIILGNMQGGLTYLRNRSEINPPAAEEGIILEIAPNPADDIVYLYVNKSVKVDIYSILGQRVLAAVPLTPGRNAVDISLLSRGIFLIRTEHPNFKSVIRKLIIQH